VRAAVRRRREDEGLAVQGEVKRVLLMICNRPTNLRATSKPACGAPGPAWLATGILDDPRRETADSEFVTTNVHSGLHLQGGLAAVFAPKHPDTASPPTADLTSDPPALAPGLGWRRTCSPDSGPVWTPLPQPLVGVLLAYPSKHASCGVAAAVWSPTISARDIVPTTAGGVAHDTESRRRRRVGATHPSLVPPAIIEDLLHGAETVNFMEQIALDQGALLTLQYPGLASHSHLLRHPRLTTRMRLAGQVLLETRGIAWLTEATRHSSDTVRAWGAMAVGLAEGLSLEERLGFSRTYAADRHFGVREWAWLGVRQQIVLEPERALQCLLAWSDDPSARIRRFISESTRPIGVWSRHIPLYKAEPWRALPMLDVLRHDSHTYVQDSVGNWLNDVCKTQPDWVSNVCVGWTSLKSPSVSPRLLRRARRSISK